MNQRRRWRQRPRRRREVGSCRPVGSSEHQTENRRAECTGHLRGAGDANSSRRAASSSVRQGRARRVRVRRCLRRPGISRGRVDLEESQRGRLRSARRIRRRCVPNMTPGGPRPLPTPPVRPQQAPQGLRPSGGVGQQRPGAPRFTPPPMRPDCRTAARSRPAT